MSRKMSFAIPEISKDPITKWSNSMNIYSIYKATNIINGKSYIGFDACWPTRQKDHKRIYCKKNNKFYAAIRKHGWDNFKWEVLYQSVDKEYTHKVMEEYFIRDHNTYCDTGHGYNMSFGGDGGNRSIQTRDKMSNYATNRSPLHRTKLNGQFEKGCVAWNRGMIGIWKRTEEFKENLRRPKSEGFKENLRKPKPKVVCRIFDQKEMAIQHFMQWLKRS